MRRNKKTFRLLIGGAVAVSLLVGLGVQFVVGHEPQQTDATAPGAPRDDQDISFAVSPDGSRIVFSGAGNGYRDLYLLDLATSRVSRVTNTTAYETDPTFSRDGQSLFYASAPDEDKPSHLFRCSLTGTDVRQITTGDTVSDRMPSVSKDGKRLVFTRSDRSRPYEWGGSLWSDWDVYWVSTDGTGLRRATYGKYVGVVSPQFSLDGSRILFAAGTDIEEFELYFVQADGHGLSTKITNGGGNTFPCFSPDDRFIAYTCDPNLSDKFDLYVMRSDVLVATSLHATKYASKNTQPVFTPDGKSLLYLHGDDTTSLWQMGVNGSLPHQIADDRLFSDPLHWRP